MTAVDGQPAQDVVLSRSKCGEQRRHHARRNQHEGKRGPPLTQLPTTHRLDDRRIHSLHPRVYAASASSRSPRGTTAFPVASRSPSLNYAHRS